MQQALLDTTDMDRVPGGILVCIGDLAFPFMIFSSRKAMDVSRDICRFNALSCRRHSSGNLA
jgi:hypothetical protein